MIQCSDTERLATAFVDGELDERRASALRGHLRGCAGCRATVAAEATLRERLGELAPVDPPPAVWEGIEQRLADAEQSDARRSRLWWWWQGARRTAGIGALALAGAAVIVWVGIGGRRGHGSDAEPVASAAADAAAAEPLPTPAPAPAAPVMPSDAELTEAVAQEVASADRHYLRTLSELQGLAAAERAHWTPAQAAAFDERLAALEADVQSRRVAIGDPLDLPRRDTLYRAYRAEISFLQQAVLWPDEP